MRISGLHILLIIVDQMRNPGFWLPSGGQSAVNALIPNISGLASQSFSFPNYWVNATVCGPSRSCLLTGLYTQQTGMFSAANYGLPAIKNYHPTPPPLLPYNLSWANNNSPSGFPTIGNVLSQILPIGDTRNNASYDCTWIGKWHLSCQTGTTDGSPGQNGPSDYGFSPKYSLPTTGAGAGSLYPTATASGSFPSPNGFENEGAGGTFSTAL